MFCFGIAGDGLDNRRRIARIRNRLKFWCCRWPLGYHLDNRDGHTDHYEPLVAIIGLVFVESVGLTVLMYEQAPQPIVERLPPILIYIFISFVTLGVLVCMLHAPQGGEAKWRLHALDRGSVMLARFIFLSSLVVVVGVTGLAIAEQLPRQQQILERLEVAPYTFKADGSNGFLVTDVVTEENFDDRRMPQNLRLKVSVALDGWDIADAVCWKGRSKLQRKPEFVISEKENGAWHIEIYELEQPAYLLEILLRRDNPKVDLDTARRRLDKGDAFKISVVPLK